MSDTKAGVFIIESLRTKDELKHRFEGRILRDILLLSGKKAEYCYIRTWKEAKAEMFQRFYDSGLRYLHISCHGNRDTIAFTLDRISFEEFGKEIKPYLYERRLFFSACEVVNPNLQKAIMPGSDCYSLIGPKESIRFSDAVIMWATFYHLMLRNSKAMKPPKIRAVLHTIKQTFGTTFEYL
ncbi:MAG: hypothetical protein WA581_08835 [Candidatus Acidiferrales bacterium]